MSQVCVGWRGHGSGDVTAIVSHFGTNSAICCVRLLTGVFPYLLPFCQLDLPAYSSLQSAGGASVLSNQWRSMHHRLRRRLERLGMVPKRRLGRPPKNTPMRHFPCYDAKASAPPGGVGRGAAAVATPKVPLEEGEVDGEDERHPKRPRPEQPDKTAGNEQEDNRAKNDQSCYMQL